MGPLRLAARRASGTVEISARQAARPGQACHPPPSAIWQWSEEQSAAWATPTEGPWQAERARASRPPGKDGTPLFPSPVSDCKGPEVNRLFGYAPETGAAKRRQVAGGPRSGPARVATPPSRGKKLSPSTEDLREPQTRCHPGRRTGAGTRAIRSHVPRRASQSKRHPATPPSTRLSH